MPGLPLHPCPCAWRQCQFIEMHQTRYRKDSGGHTSIAISTRRFVNLVADKDAREIMLCLLSKTSLEKVGVLQIIIPVFKVQGHPSQAMFLSTHEKGTVCRMSTVCRFGLTLTRDLRSIPIISLQRRGHKGARHASIYKRD
ncbi:hypothetical protein PoB_004430000 [Plakobranchus ocellatus]|uniref:Uncharacterized protein n=1 Tax=Plakobranchus ocellatus TaxID=259542 RepID=A0AAV4BE10_9GAST|nr:hypothetical protein PoB_004430000 [Plakobranchus ocellatus]